MTRLRAVLGDPCRGGMWCGAEDADLSAGVLDLDEHVYAGAGKGDGFEEATGQQGVGLGAEELCPGAGGAFGCGVDAGVGEDLPHGGGGDFDAEDEQFAVDAAVVPTRVLLREAEDQDSDGSDGARSARAFRSGHPGVASAQKVAVVGDENSIRAGQAAW